MGILTNIDRAAREGLEGFKNLAATVFGALGGPNVALDSGGLDQASFGSIVPDAVFVEGRSRVRDKGPDYQFISSFERILNPKIVTELRELQAWNKIIPALSEVCGDDISPKIHISLAEALRHPDMTVGVLRALHSQQAWLSLVQVLARVGHPNHPHFTIGRGLDFTVRALRGVNESRVDKGREGDLVKIMASYDGEPDILRTFCLKICHGGIREAAKLIYNPFEAARLAIVDFPLASELDASLVKIVPSTASDVGEGGKTYHVMSDSGHVITSGEYYRYYLSDDKNTQGVVGRRALLKILEAFCSEEYSAEKRERRIKHRKESISDLFKDEDRLSAEADVIAHPELRSRLYLRNRELVEALQKEIEQYRGRLHRELFGEVLMTYRDVGSLVQSEVGGRFLGSFGRSYENLPAAQKYAFDMLNDPGVVLTRGEEAFFTLSLLAYSATRPVNKESALAPWLADLKEYRDLQAGDEMELNRVAAKEAKVKDVLQGVSSEIDFNALGRVLNALDFLRDFRAQGNRDLYQKYEKQINEICKRFEPYFKKDGKWLEDSMGTSIPMKRLGQTILGYPLGHFPGDNTSRPLFNRLEFHAIRELMFLHLLGAGSGERFFTQMCRRDFRTVVERVLVASARLDDFEISLGNDNREVKDRLNVGTELEDWHPEILPHAKYRLRADYFEGRVIGHEEFLKRAKARLGENTYYARPIRELSVGLVDPEDKHFILLASEVRKLRPVSGLEQEVKFLGQVKDHPLFMQSIWLKQEVIKFSNLDAAVKTGYLNATEAEGLKRIYEFKDRFEASGLADTVRTSALKEKLEILAKEIYIDGHVRDRVFSLSEPQTFNVGFMYEEAGSFRFLPPTALEKAFEELTNSYIKCSELAPEWRDKFKTLLSPDSARVLVRLGFQKLPSAKSGVCQRILQGEDILIQRSLVEDVEALHELLLQEADSVAATNSGQVITGDNRLVWKDGEIIVNFGRKHFGVNLLDVALRDPTYITEFMAKKLDNSEINAICSKLANHIHIVGGQVRVDEPHAFLAWARDRYAS